ARQELAEARGRAAEDVIESERHVLSMQLFESCARVTHAVKDPREQLDLLLTHKIWGYLSLGGMLAVFFGLVYGVGSLLEPPILRLFDQITSVAISWFGATGLALTIVTGLLQGLSGGVAIVLPYLLPFLIGMAILEDVGYLPRVAYLMDSLMHRIGLHGVAIVPAILGYGCNVPAVMATRILTSARDRFIAAVISTLVPCSARMTVIFGLVAFYLGPLWAMLIYALNIVVVACSGKLLSAIMPESSPGLILEVPPYHLPKAQVVLSKTWLRLREFIVVAWPVLIAGSVLLSLAENNHWDTVVNHTLAPFTALLGLPEVVGTTLIFGILRKELSMIMLVQALGTPNVLSVMTASQIVVFTLFVTFYIPCVATLAALVKETGWKLTAAVGAYSLLVATLIALSGRALRF
ncbi:MAG TPA: ferrous iron transporter B, partial [Terriglobia bacterium]|nr:ferrous iron transporter B [Terriglobia bacterium]